MIGEKQAIGNLGGIMKYSLINCSENDINTIVEYKCNNIFEYATDITLEEKNKITNYVIKDINEELHNFKMIIFDNKIVGTIGVIDYKDGKMIDEIFIEEDYRNRGIGTDIINNVLMCNDKVYLWVYINNVKAVRLYKRLGFVVKETSKERYFMERV